MIAVLALFGVAVAGLIGIAIFLVLLKMGKIGRSTGPYAKVDPNSPDTRRYLINSNNASPILSQQTVNDPEAAYKSADFSSTVHMN